MNSLFQQSKHLFLMECKRQTWFKALAPPSPCKDISCRGQLGLPSQASQVLLGHSFSLDSVLLYLRVRGLREKKSHFAFITKTHRSQPVVSPFVAVSLQGPDRLVFWEQHFGRPRSCQLLGLHGRESVLVITIGSQRLFHLRLVKAASPP